VDERGGRPEEGEELLRDSGDGLSDWWSPHLVSQNEQTRRKAGFLFPTNLTKTPATMTEDQQKQETRTHQALVSLAILKSDLDDERRDYFNYLESFLLPLLKHWPDEPVTDSLAAIQFEEEYGLKIPNRTVQLVLKRIARRGYLNKSHGVYNVSKALPDTNLTQKRAAAQKHIDSVFNAVKIYVKNKYDIEWSADEIENALLQFLGKFGVDYLRVYVYRTTLPVIPESAPKTQFILSSFVKELYSTKDPLFESVIVLIKGQMYGNALTCPDLEGLQKNFRRLTFYLDTPLVLNILNLQGPQSFESTTELISLITRLRGRIVIFDHTADEIESVLHGAANNLEDPNATGRVVRELRHAGLKKGDITLKMSRYQDELREFGIQVQKTPNYEAEFQIDEAGLESKIREHVNYKLQKALNYDVNSIRSIFAIRKGSTPRRLEDSKAVLVTNNDALSKAAYEFGHRFQTTKEVSPVITDFSLANVAWLKSPMDAPKLPEKETLAACYAALEPTSELWAKYLDELESLEKSGNITADDHAILRVSGVSEKALMDLTLGDETVLQGDTITSILERVKRDLSAEHLAETNQEKEAHKETKSKLRAQQDREKKTQIKIDRISSQIANLASLGIITTLSIVLFFGMLFSAGFIPHYAYGSTLLTALVNTIVLIAILATLLSMATGISFRHIKDKLHSVLARKIRDTIKNMFI
jgi:hypothetical protein